MNCSYLETTKSLNVERLFFNSVPLSTHSAEDSTNFNVHPEKVSVEIYQQAIQKRFDETWHHRLRYKHLAKQYGAEVPKRESSWLYGKVSILLRTAS